MGQWRIWQWAAHRAARPGPARPTPRRSPTGRSRQRAAAAEGGEGRGRGGAAEAGRSGRQGTVPRARTGVAAAAAGSGEEAGRTLRRRQPRGCRHPTRSTQQTRTHPTAKHPRQQPRSAPRPRRPRPPATAAAHRTHQHSRRGSPAERIEASSCRIIDFETPRVGETSTARETPQKDGRAPAPSPTTRRTPAQSQRAAAAAAAPVPLLTLPRRLFRPCSEFGASSLWERRNRDALGTGSNETKVERSRLHWGGVSRRDCKARGGLTRVATLRPLCARGRRLPGPCPPRSRPVRLDGARRIVPRSGSGGCGGRRCLLPALLLLPATAGGEAVGPLVVLYCSLVRRDESRVVPRAVLLLDRSMTAGRVSPQEPLKSAAMVARDKVGRRLLLLPPSSEERERFSHLIQALVALIVVQISLSVATCRLGPRPCVCSGDERKIMVRQA